MVAELHSKISLFDILGTSSCLIRLKFGITKLENKR